MESHGFSQLEDVEGVEQKEEEEEGQKRPWGQLMRLLSKPSLVEALESYLIQRDLQNSEYKVGVSKV